MKNMWIRASRNQGSDPWLYLQLAMTMYISYSGSVYLVFNMIKDVNILQQLLVLE